MHITSKIGMAARRLGTSELLVPPICLGTMTFGEQNDEIEAHAQLDYAASHGVTFVDTAEMYPVPVRAETYGRTEQIVGRWLQKRGNRNQVVLATKVAGPPRSAGHLAWVRGGRLDLTAEDIVAACEASLARLQTDWIDLYQIHWPARNAPVFGSLYFDPKAERVTASLHAQLEGLARLLRDGKVRAIGVSNETPWGVMEFCRLAAQHGLPKIASIQNAYHLLNRSFENGLDEICFREDVALLAYSPLAFGRLTGKYDDGSQGLDADGKPRGRLTRFGADWSPRYMRPEVSAAVKAYAALAAEHGLTPTQLALAYCYRKWCVTSTIVGATSVKQLRENLLAWRVELSAEVLAAVDRLRFAMRDPAQ